MFKSPTKNHFSLIFERLAAILAFFSVYLINSLKDHGWEIFLPSFYIKLFSTAASGGLKSAFGFLAFFLFVLVSLFLSYRYWRKTVFYIEGDDFIYKRDTMFKVDSRLPIQNIAMVNVESNIFERLVGTAKVKIDLNSSRTANKTDFKFVLKRGDAALLKESLLSIKSRHSAETAVSESDVSCAPLSNDERAEERTHLITFSAADALRHKLLSFPVIQFFLTITVVFILPMLKTGGNPNMNRLWFLLFLTLFGSVGSIVKGALDLGDYTVEQDSKLLYISCGILNKRNYVFERDKINAVVINQPIFARLFGLCSVSIAVVGLGNEKNETTHLSLTIKKDKADELLLKCAPDFVCKSERVRTHPFSIAFPVLRSFIYAAAVMLLSTGYRHIYVISAFVFILLFIGSFVEFFGRYYAADDDVVCYSKGMFNRSHGIVKYGDIQDVKIKTNILLKKMRLGRMSFSILSASAMKKHRTGWFDISLFEQAAGKVVDTEEMRR
ncbi:MAG: PH domain-containing protein [Clostridiales bacterium]|jgi:putative membrane protein|nr:PH domain-containing protein [Clostridiales bacterium]